ncbi:MAG: hypothetical protein RLY71_4084 [Pseudomonadota bacterium]
MDAYVRCVQCDQPRLAGQRFCPGCGLPLDATRELKHVTVLLADLCDSTAQVVAAGTEDGQAYLEAAYRIMSEAASHFGGVQIQWRGDELLALFGAPQAQEDHAAQACLAALRIVQRMAEQTSGTAPMAVRIGIDSGEVLIGPGGPALGARYSVDGTAIHLAARLERLAAPGTVLISAQTRRLAESRIETAMVGERIVRGFSQPVQVYRLVAGSNGSAWGRRRHLAPLVGREALLAELKAIAGSDGRGGLQLCGLRGDAGVGKSRVLEAVYADLEARGVACIAVAARHVASEVPFGVAADMLRALLALGAQHHARAPAVLDLLDEGDPGDAWRALSPAQRRSRTIEAVIDVIDEILRSRSLVLMVDDVFLADSDSLRLLESLSQPLATRPLLLLLSYRTEFVHRWGDAPWFSERVLFPLSGDGMSALVDALLGQDARLSPLRDLLLERADGNPFFLEQMVLMLVDQGSLVGRPGDYRLAQEPEAIGVPPSVVATIAAQVDRLNPQGKRVLEAGAVSGDPLDAKLLAAMLGLQPEAVQEQLRVCAATGLLDNRPDLASALAFRHALVRETIYNALPRKRRAELHHAAYVELRRRSGDNVAESAHVLARHAFLGCDWSGAAECSLAAMKRSTMRSSNRDALRGFERGLDAAGRIEAREQALGSELALRMAALGPMMAMGKLDDIVTNLERAEAIARSLGDAKRHAAVSLQLAVSLWTRGSYRQGLEAALSAHEASRLADSRSLQMAALQARMMLHHGLGRYVEATSDAAQVERDYAMELAARRLLHGWAVVAVVNLKVFQADLLAAAGRLSEAQALLDGAYAELAGQDHAFSRVLADFVQAGLMLMTGRAQAAVTLLQSARELCRAQDVATMLPPIVARLAGALAEDGRPGDALQLIEPALAQNLHLMGGRYNDYYFPHYHAVALRAAGRIDEAAAAADRALAAALQREQFAHAAQARLLAGRLRHELGQGAQAQAHLLAARELALQCHMPWLAAQAEAPTMAGSHHGP